MSAIRLQFAADGDGTRAATERTALVDATVRQLWTATGGAALAGITVAAIGGYGRGLLFPSSDVDVLFCAAGRGDAERAREAIRQTSQGLWDCGLRGAPATRTVAECERFDVGNAEMGLSLLDRRLVAGDADVFAKLDERVRTRLMVRDAKAIRHELLQLTRERHGRYGDTLFHLEPNIKDCPGGLRDANVCKWLAELGAPGAKGAAPPRERDEEFEKALEFLASARCFLHFRAGRDDNTLDWQAQDAAAEQGVGLHVRSGEPPRDAAFWMRTYFRHARTVERRLQRAWEQAGLTLYPAPPRKGKVSGARGFRMQEGRLVLDQATSAGDPAADAEVVLAAFVAVANTGATFSAESEERVADALPVLSSTLEEGPALWRRLCSILTGAQAGTALRSMHALGVLELILPEFHGIDALVIRDAYHRYTVDEHTFVLIDTLHGLATVPPIDAPRWRQDFQTMVVQLGSPGLLYLAALLHDTGKARAGGEHALESVKLARVVLKRLEMEPYDAALVLRLIELHLEMSAALRRDIFDAAAVRAFASRVQTHELLRMLTLFTYADIQAVHPDALTPWKAENLWRLSMNASNQLDRNVDEERVHPRSGFGSADNVELQAVLALLRGREGEVEPFLEGFPERYLKTRSAEAIRQHFLMTGQLEREPFQLGLQVGSSVSEITLITRDRPRLFADMAAALAGWGMNVVTADAFSNAAGVVVDSFRFTDTFRTLELNESERARFVASVRDLVAGRASVEAMLSSRRRGRKRTQRLVVSTRVEFDPGASAYSTVLQVIAQDVPGLLRAISSTLSAFGCNLEIALIDTEGETAIDVFYVTREARQLRSDEEAELRARLLEAIGANAA